MWRSNEDRFDYRSSSERCTQGHTFKNENEFSVSLIVKKILKHCDLWNDSSPPLAPNLFEAELEFTEEVTIDLDFFDMIA